MASWQDVGDAAPELARSVQIAFDAHLHKTIATLRRDGSPRISGVEATFSDGELWLGMMPGSIKARDLLHDPRLAIHSATADSEMKNGDAKIAGRAVEIRDPETIRRLADGSDDEAGQGEPHLFRVDVTEAVLTRIGEPADHLVIESWHEGRGLRKVKRR
jgi:pyridoxamine 5'-phosphate oxidase-like protein